MAVGSTMGRTASFLRLERVLSRPYPKGSMVFEKNTARKLSPLKYWKYEKERALRRIKEIEEHLKIFKKYM